MGKEPEAVSALKAAANMLVAAHELEKFSYATVQEAFKLLYSSNPRLVNWVFKDLAEFVKEATSVRVDR